MTQEITAAKIRSFIQGNINFYKEKIVGQPVHLQEQYLYRISLCINDCVVNKACKHCGCPVNKKMWAPESNGCEYPDFMSGSAWQDYKEKNKIDLEKIKINIKDVL